MEVSGRKGDKIDVACNTCKDQGFSKLADGFCGECEEYMCQNCFDTHIKFKLNRDHTFTSPEVRTGKCENADLDKCNKHFKEIVKFYCPQHEQIGCGDCMILDHKACKVEYIPDRASTFKDSKDFKELTEGVNNCHRELKGMLTAIKGNKKQITDNNKKFANDVNMLREEIIAHVNKLTNAMLKQGEDMMATDMKKIEELEREGESLLTELSLLTKEVESHIDKPNKLFVHSITQKPMLLRLKVELGSIRGKNRIDIYEFRRDENIERLIKECKQLGRLQKIEKGNDRGIDFARGEGNIDSSSSDDDDDDDEDDSDLSDDGDNEDTDVKDVSKFDHKWGEADDNVISMEEATCRLAVCNMDWDRMKAKDIFVLLNSFKPTNGIIKSVKVYPSEFGKERMAEEAKHGPRELKEMKIDSDEEEGDLVNEEGTTYHREKLRQYQLTRLKYYYAVVECDTIETADHLYKECDGMEYESSATKLDLRFIPDEETFDDTEVSSVCREVPSNYKPQFFFNAALAQSKVDLTWDETDRERVQLTAQQFSNNAEEAEEEDLKAYLASSSDEEGPDYGAIFGNNDDGEEESDGDSDDDKKLDKYKKLLTDLDSQDKKKKRDVEMEISWEPGLREATEKIVKKKKQSKDSTVWEDYLQKKKEKKRQKIEERKKKKTSRGQLSDDDQKDIGEAVDGDVQAFSDDELPVDDDMAAFMAEESKPDKKKNKKKKKKKEGIEETAETTKEKAELSLLMMGEEDDKKHFNLKDLVQEDGKKKKKKKLKEQKNKQAEDDFQMNVTDPRFSAIYDSHLFNIDPSAPEYRKTGGTEAIITEKIKRSGKRDKNKVKLSNREDEKVKKPKLTDNQTQHDENLASLIKSVKSKTKHFHSNKVKR